MKYILAFCVFLTACSASRHMGWQSRNVIVNDSVFSGAHVGICLYDAAAQRYLYNYQGNKFFVPASNTKIMTCYAAMKNLGDSLPGIQYIESDTAIYLLPAGDPTLLYPGYASQPVISWLKKTRKPIYITNANWKDEALGAGWSWDDYNEDYMPERSALPLYGNTIEWVQDSLADGTAAIYSVPEVPWKVVFSADSSRQGFYVKRDRADNIYQVTEGREKHREQVVPFSTEGIQAAIRLLADTLGRAVNYYEGRTIWQISGQRWHTIYSQPLDSLLKPMMHRSDNFFAEQSLLMIGNKLTGHMNSQDAVAALLHGDLAGLPQPPVWADGSGLSRFNLFTPMDFVTVLNKMQHEFGMERVKRIFATGGQGTLLHYYKKDSGTIFAKTGSLAGVLALSGFLYTRNNKLLIFSVLVNNHHGSSAAIRRRIESFLEEAREKY